MRERKNSKAVRELEKKLGFKFSDKSLLERALLHRSYSSQHNIEKDNERLEFLGDSILNAAVSRMLFKKFPGKDEGELTKIRAKLVSGESLREWAEKIDLEEYISLGMQTKKNSERGRNRIAVNALEAVFGAMFLDKGFKKTAAFIEKNLKDRDFRPIMDFKSALQEVTVGRTGELPEYETLSHDGPPGQKVFKVIVKIDGKIMGTGSGSTKKAAQQEAAKEAAEKLNQEDKKDE